MKKGWINFFLIWISGIILISGCSRDVQTQKLSDKVDLRNYRTYAWLPSGDTSWNDFNVDPTVASEVRNKINSELQEIGYTINAETPDFLVLVHTKYDEQIELQRAPSSYYYYGPGFYPGPWYDYYYPYYNTIGYVPGPDVRAVEYTEGTIVIDIIDADRKEIVWRGTASDTEYGGDIVDEMVDGVDEIFEEYPIENI